MRKWLVFITCLFAASLASAQAWEVVQQLDVQVQRTYIDQLNSLYLVRQGEILKLDPGGRELARYSNKLIGEEVMLDVTNPMKVILYSPQQMQLAFLDSRLAELREQINLVSAGYEQISLAATSHSNGVWLYDPINFQMIRLNQNLEEERRSLNLGQMLRLELNPTDLVELNNKVYLTDPEHGVFVFDVFANFIRRIPLTGIKYLVISDDRLFYYKGSVIYALNLADSSEEELKIEVPGSPFFDVNRNRVVVTQPGAVISYGQKN